MYVRAKCNIFRNGKYYPGGSCFEIATTETDILPFVDVAETPVTEATEAEPPAAPKRGRKKKTPEEG